MLGNEKIVKLLYGIFLNIIVKNNVLKAYDRLPNDYRRPWNLGLKNTHATIIVYTLNTIE